MSESYDLQRFVDAQDPIYTHVCGELRRGRKASHWMWFVFPQLAGLGRSATARRYALASLEEAAAYSRHPVLGPRLRDCTELVLAVPNRSANDIFGRPDDRKFHSSMTLFAHATDDNAIFRAALARFYDGVDDPLTLARLAG